MTRSSFIPLILATFVALSGCTLAPAEKSSLQETGQTALKEDPCAGASSPLCLFINSPVRLTERPVRVPTRAANFFRTEEVLEFVDNQGRTWTAPPRTLTDGASIPELFIPIVGDPRGSEFLNAATLHDAYCGIGNEAMGSFHARRWQEVHRMFYDTLIVGGTAEVKAKIMFAAVYLAGPRWDVTVESVSGIAPSLKKAAMVKAKSFIEKENPDLNRLQEYLEWLEKGMRATQAGIRSDDTWDPFRENADGTVSTGTGAPGTVAVSSTVVPKI